MKKSLNGANPLAQQTLDLQNAEAARFKLLALIPELDGPPWNTAELQPLTATEPRAAPLTLTSDALPAGKKLFWMGNIYADGKLTPAIAYR